jgi:hypothetical protein
LKASTLADMRKTKPSGWKEQDLIDSFAARYGVPSKSVKRKSDAYFEYLDDVEFYDSLEEYMTPAPGNPIDQFDKYMTEGIMASMMPMYPPNPANVKANPPKFYKGVPLSELRRTLKKDPHYFQK